MENGVGGPHPAELGIGSVIGGYRIDAVLGRGGMGVVYRATQVALGRAVALKVIGPQFATDPAFRERFGQESQLAASLDHPKAPPTSVRSITVELPGATAKIANVAIAS